MSLRRYVSQQVAKAIDEELMSEHYGFRVEQLMELAGLSAATVIHSLYPPASYKRLLICCGPGNNGGDGLVAARHLGHFGYSPVILYPKPGKNELYKALLRQCESIGIEIFPLGLFEKDTFIASQHFDLIVDAIFGFSFAGEIRSPFDKVILKMAQSGLKTVSIDIPSGWDVEKGPMQSDCIKPDALISLSIPKLCAMKFTGENHILAGRFIPPKLASHFNVDLPEYSAANLFVRL